MIKEKLNIIKIGGNVIDNTALFDQFLIDFKNINDSKILVHGGGKIATTLADKMGIETKMIDGRRITDKATIDLVTMVYGGLINKNIVAKLNAKGSNAIGLSGADGSSVLAEKRPANPIDFGYVGDIKAVNANFIFKLLSNNIIPVFAPLTADNSGQILNTNADTMTQAIGVALSEYFDVNLVYCFEKNGVLSNSEDENSLISTLNYNEFLLLKSNGAINKGMIPKLENAFEALKKGVKFVTIVHARNLSKLGTTNQIGTIISQ